MIEFEGRADVNGWVTVDIHLDSHLIGAVRMTLWQWDRLREHRREASASQSSGLSIIVEAANPDVS